MDLNKRQKLTLAMMALAVVVALLVLLVGPEQVMTKYVVENGVKHITYVSKTQGVISIALTPGLCGVIWNFVAKRNEGKIAREPELKSLRIRGAVINTIFFVWTALPIGFAIVNIFLGLKELF